MNELSYFNRIMLHYIVMALEDAGTRVDGDTHAEIDAALLTLEPAIRQIAREEVRVALCADPDAALLEACKSALEAICAGAEPWMLEGVEQKCRAAIAAVEEE